MEKEVGWGDYWEQEREPHPSLSLVEGLVGYAGLKYAQRKLINNSLWLTTKALEPDNPINRLAVFKDMYYGEQVKRVRGGDELAVLHQSFGYPDPGLVLSREQQMLTRVNCFLAVHMLETGEGLAREPLLDLPGFRQGFVFSQPASLEQVLEVLKVDTVPLVGLLTKQLESNCDNLPHLVDEHAFVVLGEEGSKVLCWEKMGWDEGFRITTVKNIVSQRAVFLENMSLGIRAFRRLSGTVLR